MDTIVNISTPRGRGAIAVVRLSGKNADNIAKELFFPFPKRARFMQLGKLKTEYFTDQALCVFFAEGKSYTGEKMVEFYCHGGNAIAEGVLKACVERGARVSLAGEFTKRAFVNGKLTLDSAEGIEQMIDAESAADVRSGYDLLTERLTTKCRELQAELTALLAEIEAALDYPEEDIEFITAKKVKQITQSSLVKVDSLLSSFGAGKIVKHGVDIALIGPVNVGKSSLFNALLNCDRAIVSDVEGTTRDVVSASITYKDVIFNFFDTAGIRETDDKIEREGVTRSRKTAENADLILLLTNSRTNNDKNNYFITTDASGQTRKTPQLVLYCKCDIIDYGKIDGEGLEISALTGKNIDKLKEWIYDRFCSGVIDTGELLLTNERQHGWLIDAQKALSSIPDLTLDCVYVPIKQAWLALGAITGEQANETIIDEVFSRFCLGK
ncbi:MAG: tRNA uridine-5-carboxymethylaminomethyl(34) synthesis GTPase MnmE [Clostridia bacterium]|nr:tRNA uridine-5-carboxymethylaminomethyl(34) synthesis GTPase MnmE [Clostridia bacterium]